MTEHGTQTHSTYECIRFRGIYLRAIRSFAQVNYQRVHHTVKDEVLATALLTDSDLRSEQCLSEAALKSPPCMHTGYIVASRNMHKSGILMREVNVPS